MLEFRDPEGGVCNGALLLPVEDVRHIFADGASWMGVGRGEGVPMFGLEAIQEGLEDGVGVAGEVSIGHARRVDGAAWDVPQDAAEVPQEPVRRVVSAVSFAFLLCGCHAVGMPFLEPVAASGEERSAVGVTFLSVQCAGVS